MKKLRLIIYILFFTFNISLFLFTVYIETFDNIFELGKLILPNISYMKYGALIGVILVVVDFIVDKAEKSLLTREIEKTRNELNAVKAQLFDSQKATPSTPATPATDGNEAANEPVKED